MRGEAAPPEPAAADLDVADLSRSLRALMWRQVGIERTGTELATARRSIAFWQAHQARGAFRDTAGWQLQNLLTVGALVATAAEARAASVGTHFRNDSSGSIDRRRHVFIRPEHP
ncbi:MAG: hypothetical protein H0X45_15070 [Planctomycetes bacterium]|nr:hypothetical protein [Planctomycetota bacterium]